MKPVQPCSAPHFDAIATFGCGIAIADVDGDGKPDLILAGRATKNLRVLWNETGK